MEVRGVTPERVDAVEDASITGGTIDANGNLVLHTVGGAQKNAGQVIVPYKSWPVGSIYMGTTSTDPAVLLGGGTWERFGQGRVLVSQDPGQAEFDTALETGGAKTHQLTIPEMPSHNHGGATVTDGVHSHTQTAVREIGGGVNAYAAGTNPLTPGGQTATDGAHAHAIPSQGGNVAHNNLQPYIVVYMWRRTA